jgi:hypothetical protein
MNKLSKDELKIVWWLVYEYKYDIYIAYKGDDRKGIIKAMDILEEKLLNLSWDKRRKGRKSLNHFSDCLNRFIKKSIN